MRKLTTILIVFISIFCFNTLFAQSDVYVNGYFKKNGTYVQPHFKTAPNSSMFDNYSTKGNYNPYTGKPGWIDPYSKVSSSYYNAIPYSYRPSYENLFVYLNIKDSYNYFKIVDAFDYQYKLFFTGIFKLNNNDTKEANQIFDILRKNKGSNIFITEESNYWFVITSKYLDADKEFENLYASSARYDKDGNYQALENQLNKVKNPLNFFHKYLIKFNVDLNRHKYIDAKNSLDSLMSYASETELQDTLFNNYEALVENLNNMQNTLDTHLNNTYYYQIQKLIHNLVYFLINKRIPEVELKNACFNLINEDCTVTDSVYKRILNDTSRHSSGKKKFDVLTFNYRVLNNSDTIVMLSFQFFDDSSYLLYKNELTQFNKSQSTKNSIAFNFGNFKDKEKGFECLINPLLIGGISEIKLEKNIADKYSKMYILYFYSIVNKGNMTDLSVLFK